MAAVFWVIGTLVVGPCRWLASELAMWIVFAQLFRGLTAPPNKTDRICHEKGGAGGLPQPLWTFVECQLVMHERSWLHSMGMRFCLNDVHYDAAQSLHSCVVLQLCSWGANLLYMSAQDYDLAIVMDYPLMWSEATFTNRSLRRYQWTLTHVSVTATWPYKATQGQVSG